MAAHTGGLVSSCVFADELEKRRIRPKKVGIEPVSTEVKESIVLVNQAEIMYLGIRLRLHCFRVLGDYLPKFCSNWFTG